MVSKNTDHLMAGATCLLILILLSVIRIAHGADFNIKNFGAKADGKSDDSQAISTAWKAACVSTDPSTVLIPNGKYMVGSLTFQGPCKAPVSLQVQGNLLSPIDLNIFNSPNGWISFQNIDRLMVSGAGTFDGQGSLAWSQNNCSKTGTCNSMPINLAFTSITNSKIQDISSLNSKLFHMNILQCKNVTLQHIIIRAPQESLNTDGIHIGLSSGINVTGADIKTGDDCVSLGDGSQQINIEKVTCGPGHGISVGSLGKYHNEQPVRGVTVRNCTLTSTMFGVRVKTWPDSPSGVASHLLFEDIVMNNVSTPLLIDQEYCPYDHCKAEVPSRVKISNVSFKNIRGTSATKLAVKLTCSRRIPCKNVQMSDISLQYNGKDGPITSECKNVLKPSASGKLNPPACANYN
ncbi:hypothetical protein F2P56_003133 [Juglans regia]|uniref:Exopolygalacturonase clone GBGA483-like n=2 Tax=Juglans regia TaxID=51240 RepID=A0A2I4H1A5_JUGRE|nr:exopolygalacturonase clone GBGA483-like [Juglans regia]KAF5482575.1 hypothetical protein F2P56_003133 [Juglans regia]